MILGQGHGLYRNGTNPWAIRDPCGSGFTREECNTVPGTGCAGARGHARSHTDRAGFKILGQGHGLYRNGTNPGPGAIPVGAGSPAKNATQCLAPAVPVFAGKPAPTPTVQASRSLAEAMAFTGMAPPIGPGAIPVGAGSPAKNATRCLAPAVPVFAGMPAPTPTVQASRSLAEAMAFTGMAPTPGHTRSLWERVHPRRMRHGAWHRLCRCSRACPLPHRPCKLQDPWPRPWPLQEWHHPFGHTRSLWERARPRRMQRSAWHRLCRCSRACPLPHRPCKLQDPWPRPWPLQEWHHPFGHTRSLWERVHPRRMRHGAWHRLCRCSRVNPLSHRPCKLQDPWPRPWPLQEWHQPRAIRDPCGSGRAREECNAVPGTGCADVRGHARSHTDRASFKILGQGHGLYRNATNPGPGAIPVGAGAPAKNATQCLAPAVPVFAGMPAPTPTVQASRSLAKAMAFTGMAPTLGQARSLWERVHPRRMRHGAWHRLCRCSRVNPLSHRPCWHQDPWPRPWPLQKWHQPRATHNPCGSGFTREECNTVHGTGCAGVRG